MPLLDAAERQGKLVDVSEMAGGTEVRPQSTAHEVWHALVAQVRVAVSQEVEEGDSRPVPEEEAHELEGDGGK